ncbi:hypothetical protein [uncultured Phascolarctobacterium sp.]|jgi:hypothetical protein|uniref:hypothetical protein n=1 Tax=uncultured Phascolarctobacterium sp. TaxID=512296 RepID=UPI0025D89AF0|nr:hypothetical protein [uncultured Phascolarctobacterium sp.]
MNNSNKFFDVKMGFLKAIGSIPKFGKELTIPSNGEQFIKDCAQAIILTNLGVIVGDIVSLDKELEKNNQDPTLRLFEVAVNTNEKFINSMFQDTPDTELINHTKAILVKNAVVHSSSNFASTITLPYVWLFADQILGITFGALQD